MQRKYSHKNLVVEEKMTREVMTLAQDIINFTHDKAIDRGLCPGCVIEAIEMLLNNLPDDIRDGIHHPKREKGMPVLLVVEEDDMGAAEGTA